MTEPSYVAWALFWLHTFLQVVFVVRAVLRPHREPASRLAWVVVIIVAPVVGMLAYVLFGDVNIGSRRIARIRAALRRLPSLAETGGEEEHPDIPGRYAPLFRLGRSISSYPPVGGNRATLIKNSEATIDAMIADIDAAEHHV